MKFFKIIKVIFTILLVASTIGGTGAMLYFAKDMNLEEEFIITIPEGTKFVAHRGLSSMFYQNTSESFLGAGGSEFFFGIETDIWFTTDGKWVCAHDNDPFSDTTKLIDKITYAEAMALPLNLEKAGDVEVTGDFFLCDFENYLDICISHKKMPFIELKCIPTVEQLLGLVDLIKTKTNIYNVQFISFKRENIDNLADIDSKIRTQILSSSALYMPFFVLEGLNIGMNHNLINQAIIDEIHTNGKIVNLYTVNDENLIAQYTNMGVDYITTDFEY